MKPSSVLCYGIGVDSTALLIELANREAPDLVLTADTGAEKIAVSYTHLTLPTIYSV